MVNHCQGQKIEINDDKVFELNFLANHFIIKTLSDSTVKYFSDHPYLATKLLFFNQFTDNFDMRKIIDIVSQNQKELIDDEYLLLFDIQTL